MGEGRRGLVGILEIIPGKYRRETRAIESVEAVETALSPLESALSSMRAELAQEQLKKAIQLREGNRFGAALLALEQAFNMSRI